MNKPLDTSTMTGAPNSGQSSPTILANARLILPDGIVNGVVTIENGKIVDVTETSAVPAGAEDLAGDYLLPGLIELHTDNLERHIEPRPKVAWPHAPALLAHDAELAGCGITTVFDALRVGSIVDPGKTDYYDPYARGLADELLELDRMNAFRIEHFIHLRAEVCSETLVDELAAFGDGDKVQLVSMMDHTPGERQFRDISKLKDYVMGKRGFSEREFEHHVAGKLELRERFGVAHEQATVAAAQRLNAVLASHDDTTVEQVAVSAGYGIKLAEFPTTVEAAEACRQAGIDVIMGAPNIIRGGSHSGNVSALDLADRDLLDIVSSDYVPSALLLSAFHLAERWGDLPKAIRTVTDTPARAGRLTDRGRIETGLRADLVRVSMAGATPVPRGTWCGGKRVA